MISHRKLLVLVWGEKLRAMELPNVFLAFALRAVPASFLATEAAPAAVEVKGHRLCSCFVREVHLLVAGRKACLLIRFRARRASCVVLDPKRTNRLIHLHVLRWSLKAPNS